MRLTRSGAWEANEAPPYRSVLMTSGALDTMLAHVVKKVEVDGVRENY